MGILPAPITAGYQNTTQAAFISMLSERLGDTGNVYWSQPELRAYLIEALRAWQAYTGWYRTTATLQAKATQAWYDLSTSLFEKAVSYKVTDTDVAGHLAYHLLEPQLIKGAWAGTDQFDLASIQAALTNRVNRFLSETGVVINRIVQQSGASPVVDRVLVTGAASKIRRLAWIDLNNFVTQLWLANEWEINAFLASQPDSDTPMVYSVAVAPPTSVRLAPPPTQPGLLEALIIPAVSTFPMNGTPLGIPDELVWGVKFGVLADLLSADGQAKDLERAAYCEARFGQAIELAKVLPSVLQANLTTGRVWISTVFELDSFKPGWENFAPSMPTDFAMAGRGLAVLSPPPSADANYALSIIGSVPIPATDADYIQIDPSVLSVILDYAQHLASFKMGGTEFAATQPLAANFIRAAGVQNARLRQLSFYNDAIRTTALKEQAERPQLSTPLLVSYAPQNNG